MEEIKNLILPLEVAVFSKADALRAQHLGAARIELNAHGSYNDGGLTPSVAELTAIGPELRIPIRIMIRPRGPPSFRGQDFLYTESEVEGMERSMEAFIKSGFLNPLRGDGFVFGALERSISDADGDGDGDAKQARDRREVEEQQLTIDLKACKKLVEYARPFGCFFHRAFDSIASTKWWEKELKTLMNCGFQGLLTSGGPGNFCDNIGRIEQICNSTKLTRFQIIVGGGVRHHNIKSFVEHIATFRDCDVAIHTAAIKDIKIKPKKSAFFSHSISIKEMDPDKLNKLLEVLAHAKPN